MFLGARRSTCFLPSWAAFFQVGLLFAVLTQHVRACAEFHAAVFVLLTCRLCKSSYCLRYSLSMSARVPSATQQYLFH